MLVMSKGKHKMSLSADPLDTHAAFTSCSLASLRPESISFAPTLASLKAKCSPMPDDAPVIQITFPCN